jgi:hypothetical protein
MFTTPRRVRERLLIVLVVFTTAGLASAQAPATPKAAQTPAGEKGSPGNQKQPAAQTKTNGNYRVVTEADGLSCRFSQDIATSYGIVLSGLQGDDYIDPGPPKSGVTMWSKANHFKCKDKTGMEREIELTNKVPNLSADVKNGKLVIATKEFGTLYREEKQHSLEMTESQIMKLKTSLGF